MSEGGFPSYEKLTSLVLMHFPESRWKRSHYAWYKSKIKTGDIEVPGMDAVATLGNSEEAETEVQESIEASLSLERDIHAYLASRINEVQDGLVVVENGIEYQTDAGRIDILAKDNEGNHVVIELKAGKAKDGALGQLLGYMGCVGEMSADHAKTRGILVAAEFDQRVVYAAKGLPHVKLFRYKVSLHFQEI